jgi:hypothetical protein
MFTTAPSAGLADWVRFREWVETKRVILDELKVETDSRAFAQACASLAHAQGFSLCEADVAAAIAQERQAWLQRHLPVPMAPAETSASGDGLPPPAHWMPVHLGAGAESLTIDWADFGGLRLSDPFFEQSAGAVVRSPAALLFRRRCSMDTLEALLGAEPPELRPAGFVFHLSRCGSTLLAQVLAASPRHRVLSEAPPLDQLLAHDAAAGLPRPRRVARLRALVNAYARRRFPEERRLFIKWDAWHTLHLEIIQEAFPDTPWIYLHREPVEILVSQRRQRGYQFLPGMMKPALFGITPERLPQLDFDAYAARVLGASAAAAVNALARSGRRGLAVDYARLRESLPGLMWGHFGLRDCDVAEETAMRAAAARNAKNPVISFSSDSEEKRREADAVLHDLADRWLGESRRALLALNTPA